MTQLVGFKAAEIKNLVCKLKKSLYRLKRSLRQWYKQFDSFKRCKYTRSKYDLCVYYKLSSGEYIYLLLYVEDMLIASKSKSAIDKLKKHCHLSSR